MSHLSTESDTTLFPVAESFAGTAAEHVENPQGEASILNVVSRWHDDTHRGAFVFCMERPCHGVRQVAAPEKYGRPFREAAYERALR